MSFSKELKRQLIHASGIVTAIPIILYDTLLATQILALGVLLFFVVDAYYVKRSLLKRTVKQIVKDFTLMERKEKQQITQDINKFQEFETSIIKKLFLPVSRTSEARIFLPTFLFFLSSLLTLVLFGPKIAVICIITLAVGDSVSTIFGVRYGKKKWPHNPNLSIEGSFAFFIFVVIFIFAFLTYFPQYAVLSPWRVALIAGTVGALIETTPVINDNISIQIVVGAFIYILSLGIIF